MLITGILNPALNSLLARVRHTNTLVIVDRGFPLWPGIETVDISLVDNVPTVLQVLAAVRQNFVIGQAYMAQEFVVENSRKTKNDFVRALQGCAVDFEPHAQFRQRIPQAIGIMITSQVVGRLYPRIGPRRLVVGGLVSLAIISLLFIKIDLTTSLWLIRALMFTRGICVAFAFVPLQAATYSNISRADTGRASALFSTQRQFGGALGVAALATVWIGRTKALSVGATGTALTSARVGGFHDAFIASAVFAAVGAGAALLIRDRDAASTLPRLFKVDDTSLVIGDEERALAAAVGA